jgi:hypothetical protein
MNDENEKLIVGALDRITGVLDTVVDRLDKLEAEQGRRIEGDPRDLTPEAEPQAEWVPDDTEPVLPDPPDDLKAEWAQQAPMLFENWSPQVEKGLTLDVPSMVDAYTRGGPLWLSAYAHEFLMGLPYNWRQIMVQQVNTYAPVAGGQLGRDILRMDTESANSWAYDRGLEQADKRLKGLVEGRNIG